MHAPIQQHDLLLLPDPALESGSSELVHSLLRLVQIAQYRRKTIVQAVCISVILGAIYFAVAPRYYDARAKLLISRRNQDQVATMGEQPSLDSTMATHREICLSPVVIQAAIEQLLPEHRIDLEGAPPSDWRRVISQRLSARTTRKADFIELSYRSRSPEAAAAVVSAVIQSYLGFIDRTHSGSANEVIANFSREREEVTQLLAVKQASFLDAKQKVGQLLVQSDQGVTDPTIQGALQLYGALMETKQKRLKLQGMLASVTLAIERDEDLQHYLVGLEEIVGRQMLVSALGLTPQDLALVKAQEQKMLDAQAELQRVAPFYGPSHPTVVELNERIKSIEEYLASYRDHASERLAAYGDKDLAPLLKRMLEQSVAQSSQEEVQLNAAFAEARDEAARRSRDIVQLQNLEREISRIEAQESALVAKIQSVDIQHLQAPIQATVVQEPLPDEHPASPQLRFVAMLSLLGGLIVGGVIAYVQDVLDDRFGSPEEMTAQLGVPVLSMVRRLESIDGSGLDIVHTFLTPSAVETEAFRTLRTALTLSNGATGRIAISSAEPGDGKTTVTANLAVSFAQAGKRTIVIDADLRKPGMTTLMGLKGRPGVADLLYGQESAAGAAATLVHHTALTGLDVLPAGLRRPNPAELLSSQHFVELLAWAEANYDQVLVDCPPVLAVSDAQIVGRLVDGAILVVQPQKNHRRLVARACHSFASTGTNMLGIVANGLPTNFNGSYGYGYGYGYGNGSGYGYGHEEAGTEHITEPTGEPPMSTIQVNAFGAHGPSLEQLRDEPVADDRPARRLASSEMAA